ncbi:MAG: hypothetical protein ACW99G_04880 [Candidatus Thorarchaeota archaeon]|jgi:hypothetical protein
MPSSRGRSVRQMLRATRTPSRGGVVRTRPIPVASVVGRVQTTTDPRRDRPIYAQSDFETFRRRHARAQAETRAFTAQLQRSVDEAEAKRLANTPPDWEL